MTWNYFRRVSGERVANRLIARLLDCFELLAEHPYIGVPRSYVPGIRTYPAPNTRYVILYFPEEVPVQISRVLHGSQDIARLFE